MLVSSFVLLLLVLSGAMRRGSNQAARQAPGERYVCHDDNKETNASEFVST